MLASPENKFQETSEGFIVAAVQQAQLLAYGKQPCIETIGVSRSRTGNNTPHLTGISTGCECNGIFLLLLCVPRAYKALGGTN